MDSHKQLLFIRNICTEQKFHTSHFVVQILKELVFNKQVNSNVGDWNRRCKNIPKDFFVPRNNSGDIAR